MANLETITASDFGGISRRKNSKRLWVPASMWNFVTGTWTFTVGTNHISMVKTDADNTSTAYIPFPAEFSMGAYQSGSNVVDRGIRILGIEVLARFATADLDAVPTLILYSDTLPANGGAVGTSAVLASTTGGNMTVTAATTVRRMNALVAARDRVFTTDTNTFHAEVVVNAAATTAVSYYGAFWHFEYVED